MTEPDFEAVVVGASVAGCTAARLFAQRGARVALVERRPDVDAYKTVCTHYIQPSATPTIEKLPHLRSGLRPFGQPFVAGDVSQRSDRRRRLAHLRWHRVAAALARHAVRAGDPRAMARA